jgi:hypothetical protein
MKAVSSVVVSRPASLKQETVDDLEAWFLTETGEKPRFVSITGASFTRSIEFKD